MCIHIILWQTIIFFLLPQQWYQCPPKRVVLYMYTLFLFVPSTLFSLTLNTFILWCTMVWYRLAHPLIVYYCLWELMWTTGKKIKVVTNIFADIEHYKYLFEAETRKAITDMFQTTYIYYLPGYCIINHSLPVIPSSQIRRYSLFLLF